MAFPKFDVKSAEGKPDQSQSIEILSAQAETVFEAQRNLHLLTPNSLMYGHVGWILVGENSARESLADSIDFQIRDYERGFNTNVAIIKGSSVDTFIKAASQKENSIRELISGLLAMAKRLSISDEVTFADLIAGFSNEYSAFCVPYFTLDESTLNSEDPAEIKIEVGGLAVVEDKKLIDFLDKDISKGVNWIKGNIESDSIEVKDDENRTILN